MSPYYAGGLGIPYMSSMMGQYGMGLGGLGGLGGMYGLGGMGGMCGGLGGLGMGMGLGGMGMGMGGMGYPYGIMLQNPYGYSGMVSPSPLSSTRCSRTCCTADK